jgi:hypothetical protein
MFFFSLSVSEIFPHMTCYSLASSATEPQAEHNCFITQFPALLHAVVLLSLQFEASVVYEIVQVNEFVDS